MNVQQQSVDAATAQQNLDLAVIGNGRTAALVNPMARIVWWCFPRFDGDPVFCRLLAGDEEKGFTDVVLDGLVSTQSEYVRNTAIVTTVLTDAERRCGAHHRFRAALLAVRPHLPPAAADAHHRADRRACRASPSASARPPRMAAADMERAFGSNHIRYTGGNTDDAAHHRRAALLYRPRVAVRAVAAAAPGVRRRHAVRGRARHHLPRVLRPHARLLAGMGAPARHLLRMAGRGDPRRDHAQAVELRGDRRDHRGAHHLDPGSARLGPHLGLPLLLAARRLFRGACAQPHRRDAARWRTTSPTSSPS